MSVLVTGASGFIGRNLLERLPKESTIALGRTKPKGLFQYKFVKSNIDGVTDYSDVLMGVRCIVHLAARVHVMKDCVDNPLESYRAVNTYGTANLARQAANAGVKRFVFISSIKVNGESTIYGRPYTPFDIRNPKDDYALSKSEAELELLSISKETGMEVVIIRPTLVYGPNVKANFSSLMNLVSKGIPLPFGRITHNKRSLVFVDNLVDLIVSCLDHPNAVGQVFLVSDDCDISTSQMVGEMSEALGVSQWQIPIPILCYKLYGKLFKKSDVTDRLIGSLQVDISHTKDTLGWTPLRTLHEGMIETGNAFLEYKKVT
ncbi:UDP-glucose 4-epimerase family protein [Vibrio brasiliensis]|uniref:NAD-dependent epimerase/dehydratase n=1 Tax=Vibrio brasiliensis LMG 20546 TaxID=945543 RepID=E8M061_9VIBR|nr:SDR family oxidoreductase [Vibrio brasiliensis]EGA63713.1 NAD-dependent epimerase/dehydratase [Vibrio brasiliensis LMG 20546]